MKYQVRIELTRSGLLAYILLTNAPWEIKCCLHLAVGRRFEVSRENRISSLSII